MLASGKKWNKEEAQTGEATWQAQPENRTALAGCLSLCGPHFYYTFQVMKENGLLNMDNPIHKSALHYVFLPRINRQVLKQHGITILLELSTTGAHRESGPMVWLISETVL